MCGGCLVWGLVKKKILSHLFHIHIVPLRLQKAFGCTDAGTSVWSGFSGLDTIIVAITVFCECSSQSTKLQFKITLFILLKNST